MPNCVKAWLDPFTGRLLPNEICNANKDYLPVMYCTKMDKSGIYTFTTCPKCLKQMRNRKLSNFATKGNIPFYNLTKAQFEVQPEKKKELINKGRKVLLFSDSRQNAAQLALELSRSANADAFRQVVMLAVDKLKKANNVEEPTLDLLYSAILQVSIERNLSFFSGASNIQFEYDKRKFKNKLDRALTFNRPIEYRWDSVPEEYNEQLLTFFCESPRSFKDIGIKEFEQIDKKDKRTALKVIQKIANNCKCTDIVVLGDYDYIKTLNEQHYSDQIINLYNKLATKPELYLKLSSIIVRRIGYNIAGMTDSYAREEYKRLYGVKMPMNSYENH